MNDKLSKNPQLKQLYEETLEKDLLNGYVAKVDSDTEDSDSIASLLPHHPVTNENKPGKVRRVANASSVFQGQSLNSSLLKGPDLLSNLTGVILQFREDNIALSADIEQMFMQVKVTPEDRNVGVFSGLMMVALIHTSTQAIFWRYGLALHCIICTEKISS